MKFIYTLIFSFLLIKAYSQNEQFNPSTDIIQINKLKEYYLTYHKDSTCTFTPYIYNEQYKIAYQKSYRFKLKNLLMNSFSECFFDRYKANLGRNIIGGMRFQASIYHADSILNLNDRGNSEFLLYVNSLIDSSYNENNLRDSLYDFYYNLPDLHVQKFWKMEENLISVKEFNKLKNGINNSRSFKNLIKHIQKHYNNSSLVEKPLENLKKWSPNSVLYDELSFLWNDKIYFRYPILLLNDDKTDNLFPSSNYTLTSLKYLLKNNKFSFKQMDKQLKMYIQITAHK